MAALGIPGLMPPRRLIPIASSLGAIALMAAGGFWLADQAAFVTTSDARVRARMVTLSSEIAGQIVDMPISAGDRVVRGQSIFQLDDRKARLALALATLELKALEITIERQRLDADVIDERGRERVASLEALLAAAAADLAAARAVLARTEADHARTTTLHRAGLVAQGGLDRSTAAREVARQAVVRAEAGITSQTAGLREAHVDLRTADVSRREADALVVSAHALRQRIALLKVDLGLHAVVSPIDGVINEVFAEAGEHVGPGVRVALAHATGNLWLEANIKETDLARVRVGAHADIRLDAARQPCGGRVERIGETTTAEFALVPNANPAGVFTKITQRVPVRVRLGAACREARPGAMATLRIRAQ